MKRKAAIIAVFFLAGIFSTNVIAGSLSTTFGDIYIENLQPGEEYGTKDLINLPLRIKNDSSFEVFIKVEVMVPSKQEIKEGFDPLPDASWIRLERSTFTVESGGLAETDVFINVPKDNKLRGKRYQLYLHSYTMPTKERNISVGLASRLSFTIAEKESLGRKKDEAGVIVLKPDNLFLIDIDTGRKVDVWKEASRCIELFNPNKVACRYRIESISLKAADVTLRKGFEETPDPAFLSFDEITKKVLPGSSEKLMLYFNIPDKPEYREKNYMFVVKAIQATGGVSVKVLAKVFVMTK